MPQKVPTFSSKLEEKELSLEGLFAISYRSPQEVSTSLSSARSRSRDLKEQLTREKSEKKSQLEFVE